MKPADWCWPCLKAKVNHPAIRWRADSLGRSLWTCPWGAAAMRLADGAAMQLDRNTIVALSEVQGKRQLAIKRGVFFLTRQGAGRGDGHYRYHQPGFRRRRRRASGRRGGRAADAGRSSRRPGASHASSRTARAWSCRRDTTCCRRQRGPTCPRGPIGLAAGAGQTGRLFSCLAVTLRVDP